MQDVLGTLTGMLAIILIFGGYPLALRPSGCIKD
jgi:hypothetical protein